MSTPENSTQSSGQKTAVPHTPSVRDIYYPRKTLGHQNVIYLASFPEIIFFWPTILISFLSAMLQSAGLFQPVTAGWLFTIVILFNFLVLVQDFDQKQFAIVCLAFVAVFLLIWIANLYGILFFKSIAHWIASFEPSLSTHSYLIFGFMLSAFFVWGALSPLFSYWLLSQNEFVHFTQPIGRDTSIARLGCTVTKEIPDVLECLLAFGGGTLVIKKDNQVLASIRNIPFLSLRMEAIEHMLAETRVTVSPET